MVKQEAPCLPSLDLCRHLCESRHDGVVVTIVALLERSGLGEARTVLHHPTQTNSLFGVVLRCAAVKMLLKKIGGSPS